MPGSRGRLRSDPPLRTRLRVHGADVSSLQALGALADVELHLLPLGEGAEAVGLNRGVVAEDILAAVVLRNEAETLRVVEPLHSTACHVADFFLENGADSPSGPLRVGSDVQHQSHTPCEIDSP